MSMINPNISVSTSAQVEDSNRGQLRTLAREVQDASVKRKLFSDLRDWKIGTTQVELQAWKLVCDRKGECVSEKRVGKRKWERVCNERDPRIVCDVLGLKIAYCLEEEKGARLRYRKKKRELERQAVSETSKRRVKRLVAQINRTNKNRWVLELRKNSQKIEWASKKLELGRRKNPSPLEDEAALLLSIAQGRGPNRRRIRQDIPLYGGVE